MKIYRYRGCNITPLGRNSWGGRWEAYVGGRFVAADTLAGIKAHPHMFRHSAAVWMAEDRVPMEEIASFLGHRDINVTVRVYARYHPDYLRNAARSLTW